MPDFTVVFYQKEAHEELWGTLRSYAVHVARAHLAVRAQQPEIDPDWNDCNYIDSVSYACNAAAYAVRRRQ